MNIWYLPLLIAAALAATRDPYKILGVTRKAGTRQIKKAFRQLSKEWHPDRNQNNVEEAQHKFQDIGWAHEVLSNETTRKIYDQYGEDGLKKIEQGGDPRRSGGFPGGFPGGGFMFESSGQQFFFSSGGPFGHQGQRQHHRPPTPVEVDWFAESPVELLTPQNRLDLDEMHPHWPDVFFLFRDDTEPVELTAASLNIVADELRSFIEFQAVDCRALAEVCRAFGVKPGSKFELHLYTQTQARKLLKGQREHRRTQSITSDESLDAETIMQWLQDYVPDSATPISSKATLKRFLMMNETKNIPSVLVMLNNDVVELKTRKLISENYGRVSFGLVKKTKSSAKFRSELMPLLQVGLPKDQSLVDKSYMIHLVDIDSISPETIQVVSLDESDFTIDLNLAIFVGTKKNGAGIYERVAKLMKPLTRSLMREGVCSGKYKKYCIIYIKDPKNDLSTEVQSAFAKYGNEAMRLFTLSPANEPENNGFLSAFGASAGDVIAWRPLRKKYLKTEGKLDVEKMGRFLEHVADGAAMLNEGKSVEAVPLVAV